MTLEGSTMLRAILPEIGLVVLAALVLACDMAWSDKRRLAWVTAGGIAIVAALALIFARPPVQPVSLWGNMLRLDNLGFVFRLVFLIGAGLTVLFTVGNDRLNLNGEFYILLLVSTLGMCLMASAADLILLYLAIETTSIPLFVLAGFYTGDGRSVESGLKYMLFAAMTSAVMLYGFSLLYGVSGATGLSDIAQKIGTGQSPLAIVVAALVLVLVGFGFKVSAAPFHFWAPDVYEGAPTPVAGFLSTASKAAGFAVILRVLFVAFPTYSAIWSLLIGVFATLSMVIGNFVALTQRNIKRFLAYSSIAQAGYILIGVAANSAMGASAAVYYLMAYLVTNLAAFGIVMVVGYSLGSDDLGAYAGLSRKNPWLAFLMLAALLSLGGIPPFAGFTAKVLVFASAIEAKMLWLAIIGVINSVVALYYYLNVIKIIFVGQPEHENRPICIETPWRVALILCAVGIVGLGIVISPWLGLAGSAIALK